MTEKTSRTLDGRLLYITNHFTHPVVAAQGASPRYHLARKLAEKGQRLLVYCPLGRHEGTPLHDFITNLRPKKVEKGRMTYLFPPLLVTPASFTTVISLIFGSLFILIYLTITRTKIEAQYCTTVLVGTVGAAIRRLRGIPLVANYGDPDFARESGLALRAFRSCENLVLARGCAHAVVYVDEVIGDYLRRMYSPAKMLFIPNGGYESPQQPVPETESMALRKRLGLEGKRVVVYAGQVSTTYRLDILAPAAERIAAVNPDVCFMVIGGGTALPKLIREAAERKVGSSFRFLGPVDYDQMGAYLAISEVGLQLLNDMCMGTKVLMYMSHHLPVVSTGSWYRRYHEFLRDGENAMLIPPTVDALSETLLQILSDRQKLVALGEAGWRSAEPYSWDAHADETLRLLREAVASRGMRSGDRD